MLILKKEKNNFWDISKLMLIILILIWGYTNETIFQSVFLSGIIVTSIVWDYKINFPTWWRKLSLYFLFMSVLSLYIFFLLSRQGNNFFIYIGNFLPYLSMLIIMEDLFGQQNKKDVFVNLKKIYKKNNKFNLPRYTLSRWKNMSYSYPKEMTAVSGLYPRSVYSIFLFLSILSAQIKNEMLPDYALMLIVICFVFFGLNDFKLTKIKKPWIKYLILFLCVIMASWSVNNGIQVLKDKSNEMYLQRSGSSSKAGWFNVFEQNSQIGETGQLKDTQKLLLRIEWTEEPKTLLPASYFNVTETGLSWKTAIFGNNFLPNDAGSRDIPAPNTIKSIELYNEKQARKYNLAYMDSHVSLIPKSLPVEPKNERSAVLIGTPLNYKRGETALPIPSGTVVLLGAENARLTAMANGSLMFSGYSGEINIQSLYNKQKYIKLQNPINEDLSIPSDLLDTLETITQEIGIKNTDSVDYKVEKIKNWYKNNFKYSLNLDYHGKSKTLSDFLLNIREGHCEYFATTTSLLLRYVGVPTRYATGFLVQERHPEEEEGMYWVRERDAHAWTVYWDGYGWQNLDTTPPMDGNFYANTNMLTKVSDFLESVQYKLSKVILNEDAIQKNIPKIMIFLIVLIVILFFFTRKKWKKQNVVIKATTVYIELEIEKEFEKEMEEFTKIEPRKKNEPWGIWAVRINNKIAVQKVVDFYKKRY